MVLRLDGVCRSFDGKPVLDHIGFEVAAGRITGFVGANGAGKTTTMRIIMRILAADAGTVTWHGRPITDAVRTRFGYMPEERGLYPKMPVLDQVRYFGELHGLSTADADRVGQELLAAVGLAERAHDKLKDLSLGNQQRAQVAAALVHSPQLLVLDEPFSGLDPLAVDVVIDVLRRQARTGVPVLFSSHQLDLVERLCDDIVIVAGGRVVANGTVEQLRARASGSRYRLVLDRDAGWVRSIPQLTVLDVAGDAAVIELPDADSPAGARRRRDLLEQAMRRGDVREFGAIRTPLSEIFREAVA
jgi:ABC-2 type transport system ATP-binding protein